MQPSKDDEVVNGKQSAKVVEGSCVWQVAGEEVIGGREVSGSWWLVGGWEWVSKWPKGWAVTRNG